MTTEANIVLTAEIVTNLGYTIEKEVSCNKCVMFTGHHCSFKYCIAGINNVVKDDKGLGIKPLFDYEKAVTDIDVSHS